MALPFCYEKIKIPSQKDAGANILVVQSIGVLHMRPCCNRRGCLPCLAALEMCIRDREGCFWGPYAALRAPVLGPAPPAIQVLNRKYRYQVSFRGKDDTVTRRLVMDLLRAFYGDSANRGITLVADIDPYSL